MALRHTRGPIAVGPFLAVVLLAYAASLVRTVSGAMIRRGLRCAGSRASRADVSSAQCCIWIDVVDDLQANLFSHKCERSASEAVRLAFHDGVARSQALEHNQTFYGGADGSILKYADIELAYPENQPVQGIAHALIPFADKHGVGYGDLIQFAAAVALSNCPGAPRLRFLAGRMEAKAPAPPHLVPSPASPASTILERVQDAGFTPGDLVALLAAHSIGRQRTLDTSSAGTPLDSTPHVFDSQFYRDVLLPGTTYPGNGSHFGEAPSPSTAQFRIASDAALARHPTTACAWQSLAGDQLGTSQAFLGAMHKLALNGQDVASLVDCSAVIPSAHTVENRSRSVGLIPETEPSDVQDSLNCQKCFSRYSSISIASRPAVKRY
ncbi:heme peroxidase [Gloeopeniophorella convolvens]|nr:heme peroxidase [Gloeopeniophorella convolvens]